MRIKNIFLLTALTVFCAGFLSAQSTTGKAAGGGQATGYVSYDDCDGDNGVCREFSQEKKIKRGALGKFAYSDFLSPKKYPRLYRQYKNNLFVIGGFILFFILLALWIYRKTTKTPL